MSSYCSNDKLCVGTGSMIGCRPTMEDVHVAILSIPEDPGASFFAVYDGHGGDAVAKYAAQNLHKIIVKRPDYQTNIRQAITQAFLDLDSDLYSECDSAQTTGSTAVIVFLKSNKLYCANAGDSHAVVCIKGVAEVLSVEHTPDNEIESRRIQEAGGKIILHRVNGRLAVSRALGDFSYKSNKLKSREEQNVIACPDLATRDITEEYEFIVLASDGIWEVLSYQEVIDFCRTRMATGLYPIEVCELLMNLCATITCEDHVRFKYGGDNMTVIIACFLHSKSYQKFVTTINLNTTAPRKD